MGDTEVTATHQKTLAPQKKGKGVSPISGCSPPEHTRFKKGQPSANPGGFPKGRPKPGLWLGALADTSETELRKITRDKKASISKRAAAMLLLDMVADGDREGARKALTLLLERIEGKPHQTRDIRSVGVEKVEITVNRSPEVVFEDEKKG